MFQEEINKLELEYTSELCKLKQMLKDQEEQKNCMVNDIKTLSGKFKTLLPIEELKLNLDKEKCRPILTLFDGSEKVLTYDGIHATDEISIDGASKESLMDDSKEHKKIIAVCILCSCKRIILLFFI
jgi:hypothetical protein